MAEYTKVAKTSDIPRGSVKTFEVGHHRLVIAHTDDGFYAMTDECSHDWAPIGDGTLHGDEIVCPRHGARFSVIDGSVKAPPAVAPLQTYQLRVEGIDILVLLD